MPSRGVSAVFNSLYTRFTDLQMNVLEKGRIFNTFSERVKIGDTSNVTVPARCANPPSRQCGQTNVTSAHRRASAIGRSQCKKIRDSSRRLLHWVPNHVDYHQTQIENEEEEEEEEEEED